MKIKKTNIKNQLLRRSVLILVLVLMQACMSTPKTLVYDGKIDSAESSKLTEKIEKQLLVNYVRFDAKEVAQLHTTIESLLNRPSTEYDYTARLHALKADLYLLQRSSYRAKKELTVAVALNPNDEYALLVQARLLASLKKQKDFLRPLVQKNPHLYRLRCELGGVYAALEQYTEAVVAFDASLPFLVAEYTQLYEKQRALCYARSSISEKLNETTEVIIAKKTITLLDMTTLTQDNSGIFDFITGGEKWKSSILAKRLKNSGWYLRNANDFQAIASRKDSALFLWHLLNIRSPEDLYAYSQFYKQKAQSPVADIATTAEYFDAVLGIVERDIMRLFKATQFQPDHAVSGLDFYKWLQKALKE